MANMITDFYEDANEIFDEEVFYGNDLLDVYNDWPDDEANTMLHNIVDEMVEEAQKAALATMARVVDEHKDEFMKLLKQKWACPDCSDEYEGEYVMLDHASDGSWCCPKCGCSTDSPEEDACIDMSDWED